MRTRKQTLNIQFQTMHVGMCIRCYVIWWCLCVLRSHVVLELQPSSEIRSIRAYLAKKKRSVYVRLSRIRRSMMLAGIVFHAFLWPSSSYVTKIEDRVSGPPYTRHSSAIDFKNEAQFSLRSLGILRTFTTLCGICINTRAAPQCRHPSSFLCYLSLF